MSRFNNSIKAYNTGTKHKEGRIIIWTFIAIVLGVILLFFSRIVQTITSAFGLDEVAKQEKEEKKQAKAEVENIEYLKATTPQTKSDVEWQQIANTIYEDLKYSALDDNKDDAGYQVARVKNDTDIFILINKFGRKQEYAFGIPIGSEKTLPEFIVSNFDRDKIDAINSNYARKGMKYRF